MVQNGIKPYQIASFKEPPLSGADPGRGEMPIGQRAETSRRSAHEFKPTKSRSRSTPEISPTKAVVPDYQLASSLVGLPIRKKWLFTVKEDLLRIFCPVTECKNDRTGCRQHLYNAFKACNHQFNAAEQQVAGQPRRIVNRNTVKHQVAAELRRR